jgi:hypothetical protein
MGLETLNKDSKVVVYNSDVDLADKGVRKNHQGVVAEALNFVKVQAGDPSAAKAGEVIMATGSGKLFVATADNTFVTFTKDS